MNSLYSQVETDQGMFLLKIGSDLDFTNNSVTSWEGLGINPNNGNNAEFSDLYKSYTVSEMNFSLGGGYFIIDNLLIGLGLNYKSRTDNVEYSDLAVSFGNSDDKFTTSQLSIGPALRYYFGDLGLWTHLGYTMAINSDSDNDTEDININNLHLALGYALSINDIISINPHIGYGMQTESTKDAGFSTSGVSDQVVKSNVIGFGISLVAHLGY